VGVSNRNEGFCKKAKRWIPGACNTSFTEIDGFSPKKPCVICVEGAPCAINNSVLNNSE